MAFLTIEEIRISGHLPYIVGDLSDSSSPWTVIEDNTKDIDFSDASKTYDIVINEVRYAVSPVEYDDNDNHCYILGNANFAIDPDIAPDTGEPFAFVVDADQYSSYINAGNNGNINTVSRKIYLGLPESDGNEIPIDVVSLEEKELSPPADVEPVDDSDIYSEDDNYIGMYVRSFEYPTGLTNNLWTVKGIIDLSECLGESGKYRVTIADTLTYDKSIVSLGNNAYGIGNTQLFAYDKIIGGSIVWNQIADSDEIIYAPNDTLPLPEGVSVTSGNVLLCTAKRSLVDVAETVSLESESESLTLFSFASDSVDSQTVIKSTITGTSDGTVNPGGTNVWLHRSDSESASIISDFQIFDLTKAFGSSIANYIYSLETNNAGSGIAWFKNLFPGDIYEFNAGELKSINGLTECIYFNANGDIVGNVPLDNSITLRGILTLNSSNNLVYDGDEYTADGRILRKYAQRAYQSGDESLSNAITDGTNTIYKLGSTTTETAQSFLSEMIVDPNGIREYVTNSIVPVARSVEYVGTNTSDIFGVYIPDATNINSDGTTPCYVTANQASVFSAMSTVPNTGEEFSTPVKVRFIPSGDTPVDPVEPVNVDVTRRAFPNTYVFEASDDTSLETTFGALSSRDISISISHVQEGSGIPSPTNIRPIKGWTSAVISGDDINTQSAFTVAWEYDVGPVYGGTLDIGTGIMKITHEFIESYAGEELPGAWISSMDAYSASGTPTEGAEVLYELDEPIKAFVNIRDADGILALTNPVSSIGSLSVTVHADEVYAIATSDADNPLIRRRSQVITGTNGIVIGNASLVASRISSTSFTPTNTGENFAVLVPDVTTTNADGESPAYVVIDSAFAQTMTSEYAIQLTQAIIERPSSLSLQDHEEITETDTGSFYRILNEYGQAGPIPDIDDSKYDEALHGQNIVANSILAAQIDVQNLMAQDMEITGNIHSNQKSYADDNHEGVFLGFDSDRRSASFGVGSNEYNHVWYKDGMVDIQADTLKLSSGVDVEEGIRIAQDAGLINSDEITRLLAQTAQIQQMIDQIQLWVSQVSTRYSILNGQDISAYEVSEVPTLDNYPAADEFWIWPICNTNLYCSDTLICGTNDYATHKWEIAHCTKDGAYYIFDIDSTQHYYWRQMTDAEYKANSSFYSAVNIKTDEVELISAQNQLETVLSVTKDGVTVTDGKLFCC